MGLFKLVLRACRLSSETNKRRELADCLSAFPAAFHGLSNSVNIISDQRPCEQVSARPKLDSPLVLAPSVGQFLKRFCVETKFQ